MNATAEKQTRSPSIREVARAAGVSPSTISRVLNAGPGVAPVNRRTRQAVMAVCRQLNYSPNIHATRLFAKRSNAIAFAIPRPDNDPHMALYFADPNLAMTLAGVSDAAVEREQQLVLMQVNGQCLRKRRHLSVLRDRSVDGMIVWGARVEDREFLEDIAREGWPLVLANGHLDERHTVPGVGVDNRFGGACIARHLIELGHRRLAYVAGPKSVRAAAERLSGFVEVCSAGGITPIVKRGWFSYEAGRDLGGRILDLEDRPTAIAAVSDLVAQGVLEAARRRGLKVPAQLSVAGAEDVYPHSTPRLTTFSAPMAEVGRQSMEVMLERINAVQEEGGREWVGTERILPVRLIPGQTTGPVRGGES